MPSSPHSTQSCEQASLDSHPRGFFSEPSSCAQSPTPQRFSGSELSASLSASPMCSLPSRLGGSSSSWEGTENYWTSTTRESRMSIYSPMHSLSLDTPLEAHPTSNSPETPSSITIGPLLTTADPSSSVPSPFLRSLSSPAVPSTNEDEPLLTKKDMRKSIKREKLQAKALKKRQKSIAKLQKELAFLEQRTHLVPSSSSLATTIASDPDSPSATSSEPRQKRVLQSSQSLKLTKSKSRLSSSAQSDPAIPIAPTTVEPTEPTEPSPPVLQTKPTPRKLLRAHTWRPASPSTHIANIAPTMTPNPEISSTIAEEAEKPE